jgi:hypothetical protein
MSGKLKFFPLTLLLIMTGVVLTQEKSSEFPVLKGPYLGQNSPGNTSQVFLDGIISTIDNPEMCAAFTADGKEFYFNRRYKGLWTIFFTKEVNENWTPPQPMPFTSNYTVRDSPYHQMDRESILVPTGRLRMESNRKNHWVYVSLAEEKIIPGNIQ